MVATLAVTRRFRSANVRCTARRILRANWGELALLADIRRPFLPDRWTARAVDRLGQVAARMAVAPAGDRLRAADGLADLRIGRNIIPIRRALSHVPHNVRHRLGAVLAVLAVFYGDRWRHGHADAPPPGLLDPIDRALDALLSLPPYSHRRPALRALVDRKSVGEGKRVSGRVDIDC